MPDFEAARQQAEKLLKEFNIAEPPVDPEMIAERMGVDVVYADFSEPVASQISGYLDMSGEPRIVINSAIPPARKIFTIAHELGHYILHREYAESENYQLLARNNSHHGQKPIVEREADTFAAHLLVPADMLKKYRKLAPRSGLRKIFAVSDVMLDYRILSVDKYGR
ncbi:ImmA/IrrE family metallo-endopeptidase [Cereibacter johrii]|uniref:ImmA/IrrE family metallo-endopeptidase n=1 Tax=Cereibacter johrii TaxID=445629 RepID=UPI00167E2D1C|nr:ImmA/IrrE family metallo-endopeptidase [Cereibacter johrii]